MQRLEVSSAVGHIYMGSSSPRAQVQFHIFLTSTLEFPSPVISLLQNSPVYAPNRSSARPPIQSGQHCTGDRNTIPGLSAYSLFITLPELCLLRSL